MMIVWRDKEDTVVIKIYFELSVVLTRPCEFNLTLTRSFAIKILNEKKYMLSIKDYIRIEIIRKLNLVFFNNNNTMNFF